MRQLLWLCVEERGLSIDLCCFLHLRMKYFKRQ